MWKNTDREQKKKCGKSQVKNVSDANVMLKKYQIFNTRVWCARRAWTRESHRQNEIELGKNYEAKWCAKYSRAELWTVLVAWMLWIFVRYSFDISSQPRRGRKAEKFEPKTEHKGKKKRKFSVSGGGRNKKFIMMMERYQGEMCLNLNTIWESSLLLSRGAAQASKRFKWSEKREDFFSLFCLWDFFISSSSPPQRRRRLSVCVSHSLSLAALLPPLHSSHCARVALCMMMLLKKT